MAELANQRIKKAKTVLPKPGHRSLSSLPLAVGVIVLATLATICALYVGKEVVLPVMMGILFKLLFQPVMDFLRLRLHLPAGAAALLIILGIFCGMTAVAFTISGPATGWVAKAPQVLPLLKEKLVLLRRPIGYLQGAFSDLKEVTVSGSENQNTPTVAVKESDGIAGIVAFRAISTVTQLLTTLIILFFLLAAGDRLLRGLIEVLPHFSDKRQAAAIATEIQHQIGGYLFTITLMNGCVGIVTGLAMWGFGLGDPILWGSIAFLLNYVPILGPLTGVGMFFLVGIVVLEWPWPALLPAAVYLLIHVAEGEIITPLLLAKRFTLNPVLVIVSLFFWYAMWGVAGALLAVPLLAMFKIVCDRVAPLQPAGHIIGA